jgi:hypothetical protein
MPKFWTFMKEFVESLPAARRLQGKDIEQIHANGLVFDRFPSRSSCASIDRDIANLDDLEAFDRDDLA